MHTPAAGMQPNAWTPGGCICRPLAFYIITEALSWVTAAAMIGMGFRMRTHTASNTRYVHSSSPETLGMGEGGALYECCVHREQTPAMPHSPFVAPYKLTWFGPCSYFYRSGQRSQAGRSTTGSGATSAAADDPPILFLHGVGLGVMPYLIVG